MSYTMYARELVGILVDFGVDLVPKHSRKLNYEADEISRKLHDLSLL